MALFSLNFFKTNSKWLGIEIARFNSQRSLGRAYTPSQFAIALGAGSLYLSLIILQMFSTGLRSFI